MSIFNKILQYKLHWTLWLIMLISAALFSAYQVNVKAMGFKVFAGKITVMLPMSLCTQYEYDICEACNLCGCGEWDQDIIAPLFGKTNNSQYYACKMPSFKAQGNGNLAIGTVILGICQSNTLTVYNPATCNIWSQFQMIGLDEANQRLQHIISSQL